MTEFVGAPFDPGRRWEQCDTSATVLGSFHRISPEAPSLGTYHWGVDSGFEYSGAFIQNAHDYLARKPLSRSSRQRVTEYIEEIHGLWHAASTFLVAQDWYGLPHVPVHGEFCQYHCRYEGDNVVGAAIDWDTARLAPRIQDVARAVNIAVGWGPTVVDYYSYKWHRTEVPEVADVARWARHYLQTAPAFSRKELALFPHVCAAMMPTAGASQVPEVEAEMAGCERVVELMRFWLDEAEAIRDALA